MALALPKRDAFRSANPTLMQHPSQNPSKNHEIFCALRPGFANAREMLWERFQQRAFYLIPFLPFSAAITTRSSIRIQRVKCAHLACLAASTRPLHAADFLCVSKGLCNKPGVSEERMPPWGKAPRHCEFPAAKPKINIPRSFELRPALVQPVIFLYNLAYSFAETSQE